MAEGSRRIWAYVAAAVVAALTLAVFFSLQDYGPESAIRRFHVAVARGDAYELAKVTEQPVNSPKVLRLAGQVRTFAQEGFHYQLVRMQRNPGQVWAAVVYKAGDNVFPMIWVVEKNGKVWKVNADKTDTIMRDSLGMGYEGP